MVKDLCVPTKIKRSCLRRFLNNFISHSFFLLQYLFKPNVDRGSDLLRIRYMKLFLVWQVPIFSFDQGQTKHFEPRSTWSASDRFNRLTMAFQETLGDLLVASKTQTNGHDFASRRSSMNIAYLRWTQLNEKISHRVHQLSSNSKKYFYPNRKSLKKKKNWTSGVRSTFGTFGGSRVSLIFSEPAKKLVLFVFSRTVKLFFLMDQQKREVLS